MSVVLDTSGSMTIRKTEVARRAVRVLIEALSDLKIPTEALTFTTGDATGIQHIVCKTGQNPVKLRDRYARLSNLEIGIIKTFDEPAKVGLRRLPSIVGTGLTPLGEAMLIGAKRLIPRRESRKVMLVVTDGRPGCEGMGNAAMVHAQDAAARISKAGIELIGIAILEDSLLAIVEDTIVVYQIEELPAQLCKLLGRTLKKGMRHVG